MADDVESWEGGSPWLFLLGLVVFLGSALLFVADLIRGIDVLRSVGANSVGAGLLIAWAAQDTYSNPDSEVASAGGAIGTALLLYGLYLLGAGAIIAVTGLVHGRLRLGFLYLGFAVATVLIGFLIFPREAVIDSEGAADGQERDGSDQSENRQDGAIVDDHSVDDQ
ncbi:hypothetical protein [Halobacteriaceae bacterium SHR40]|uniref:hypothetical protein n=1 Tax=Halovenus amylolytica TaxID=2500550 RepID=UPI000FE330DD